MSFNPVNIFKKTTKLQKMYSNSFHMVSHKNVESEFNEIHHIYVITNISYISTTFRSPLFKEFSAAGNGVIIEPQHQVLC